MGIGLGLSCCEGHCFPTIGSQPLIYSDFAMTMHLVHLRMDSLELLFLYDTTANGVHRFVRTGAPGGFRPGLVGICEVDQNPLGIEGNVPTHRLLRVRIEEVGHVNETIWDEQKGKYIQTDSGRFGCLENINRLHWAACRVREFVFGGLPPLTLAVSGLSGGGACTSANFSEAVPLLAAQLADTHYIITSWRNGTSSAIHTFAFSNGSQVNPQFPQLNRIAAAQRLAGNGVVSGNLLASPTHDY